MSVAVETPLRQRLFPQLRGLDLQTAVLLLAVTYVSISTLDVTAGGVPMKLPAVAAALALWWHKYRGLPLARHPFRLVVLAFGLAIPAGWAGVALLRIHAGDPAQVHGTTYAVQQASRFVYLLLYFPLADAMRDARNHDADRFWLWPVYLLCIISLGLFAAYAVFGVHYGSGQHFGPFQGAISVDQSGTYRGFLVNHILLIPASIFLLSRLRLGMVGGPTFLGLVVVLATAYLSHTRGIWFGIVLGVVMLVVPGPIARHRGVVRRFGTAILGFGLLVAFVVNSDPELGGRAIRSVVGTGELSGALRYEQAPQLYAGIKLHPWLGSGLGATLPSGYVRSRDSPWSFELSYLQLLFQLGAVGLVAALAAPTAAIIRCIRSAPRLHGEAQARAQVAVAALVGLLFASGSNPYLMTSVGTLALAIGLALASAATTGRSPVAGP
jgi:hypothetical protein